MTPQRLLSPLALLLLLYCAQRSVRALATVIADGVPGRGEDATSAELGRFERIRSLIPAEATVGFLTDFLVGLPLSERDGSRADIYQAQNALLPIVLGRAQASDFVVGTFLEHRALAMACARFELTVVRDLGDGLYLLGRPK